jgi:hypothetical protein
VKFDQDDIRCATWNSSWEGRVAGASTSDLRKPEPPLLDLDLDFTKLSRQFLDGLLDEESRGSRVSTRASSASLRRCTPFSAK